LEDCGGFAGAADLLKIIEDFEKYGIIGVGEEEVLKVIKHYAELSDLIQHGLHYWKLGKPLPLARRWWITEGNAHIRALSISGWYEQSGYQWGQVVGIMVKPY
jgi:hypothetical protein